MNLQDLINTNVQSTNTESNNPNTQVESTNSQAQVTNSQVQNTNTQVQDTNTQLESTNTQVEDRKDNNPKEVITIHGSDSESDTDTKNKEAKGKGREVDHDPKENYHDQLNDNFNEIQETTKKIFDTQKSMALPMSKKEFSVLTSEEKKSNSIMEDAYDYTEKLLESDQKNDSDTVDAKVDKQILSHDNDSIEKQSACVENADLILKNSKSNPLKNIAPEALQDYTNNLVKRDQLLAERITLTEKRKAELETIIEEDRLDEQDNLERETKKQKIDESEQKKNTES